MIVQFTTALSWKEVVITLGEHEQSNGLFIYIQIVMVKDFNMRITGIQP